MLPGTRRLLIEAKETVADRVVTLTLTDPLGAELPPWTPGAHVDLVLSPCLVRQYSLCGDPDDPDRWQIAVFHDPNGRGGSQFVHESLGPGDTVEVRGPRNNFPLVEADRYLFVAGGIGITPMLPMVRSVAAAGKDWELLYGGRRLSTMAFREDVAGYGERVRFWPEDTAGLLPIGSVLASGRADTAVYCCGPEPLLQAVEAACASWPDGALHVERFQGAPLAAADGAVEPFEIQLKQSCRTLVVPPDRTILDVLEEAGIDVLSSCRTGTCGTCETEVLEGVPDHRDTVLTEEERDSGGVMMICASRSRSPLLVLDL